VPSKPSTPEVRCKQAPMGPQPASPAKGPAPVTLEGSSRDCSPKVPEGSHGVGAPLPAAPGLLEAGVPTRTREKRGRAGPQEAATCTPFGEPCARQQQPICPQPTRPGRPASAGWRHGLGPGCQKRARPGVLGQPQHEQGPV
jgi:hypothetical protein